MVNYQEKEFKTILNKGKWIDSWFWGRYTINPYNGCQFGCVYCDARSSKYHLPEDFENTIVIKNDVQEILDLRLFKARSLMPDVVVLSGTTDPYQPAERKFRNTRKILRTLLKYGYPVHIITKSRLVLEDLDLLEAIAQKSWCTVSFSINTANNELGRWLDTRAPLPTERFRLIQEIKSKAPSVQTGVLAIPLVPYLCDKTTDLNALVANAKLVEADYLLFGGGMTLRDKQALFFLKKLAHKFPGLLPYYERLYGFTYNPLSYEGNYAPPQKYLIPIQQKLMKLCLEADLPYRIKRYIPKDFREHNYRLAEQMLNQAYEGQMLGEEWQRYFWGGMRLQLLKEDIRVLAQKDPYIKWRGCILKSSER